jgi:hypothetical protein
MDIDTLAEVSEDEGVIVHLRDRDGKLEYDGDKPVTMKVAGQYSERYRKAQRAITERNLKKRSSGIDVDYLEKVPLELEAACIVEWPFSASGKPLPVSPTNWSAIIGKRPWYRPQIREAIERYTDFFAENSAV